MLSKVTTQGTQAAMKEFLLPVLLAFIEANPAWKYVMYSAVGLYGVYLQYNQDKINDLIQWIDEHPEEFAAEMVKTKAFQEGFLIWFENYLKVRGQEKRKYAKRILLDFATIEDKTNFEIEKLNHILFNISPEGLQYMSFIIETIIPFREEIIHEHAIKFSENGIKSYEDYRKQQDEEQSISQAIERWIYKYFDPNSPEAQKKFNLKPNENSEIRDYVYTQKKLEFQKSIEPLSEYLNIGIMRLEVSGGGGGTIGGNSGAERILFFTSAGWMFVEYLKDLT